MEKTKKKPPYQQQHHLQSTFKPSNKQTLFCVGDRFYLCENKILCEYDYEERMVFANMAYNPQSIAHLKRQLPGPRGEERRGGTNGSDPSAMFPTPTSTSSSAVQEQIIYDVK